MRVLVGILVGLLVASCATAPLAPRGDLLADARFAPPSEPVDKARIFAMSDEMARFLRTEVADTVRERGLHEGFFEAVYKKGRLRLDYDASTTRDAAEAFAARSGNCLSLVVMATAFAKALHLPVWFNSIVTDDALGQSGGVQFFIGHVNLTLGRRIAEVGVRDGRVESLTIDFLPPVLARKLPTRRIEEERIVAMYFNNHAAESFVATRLDDAYWFARAAVLADPSFVSAWNTLGVVYRRHGDLDLAQATLAYALEREPRNTRVMSNLVGVLKDRGRAAESGALARELARLEPDPPFADFNRGVAAFRAGNYQLAKEMFTRETRRDPFYHEFRYWLALASAQLGEFDEARANLAFARDYATTRREVELYDAKLARLEARASR